MGFQADVSHLTQLSDPGDPPRNDSGSSIIRLTRGSSQSKYSVFGRLRQIKVLPALLTPESQSTGHKDKEEMEATLEILSSRKLMAQIEEAEKAIKKGKLDEFVSWEKAKRRV